MSGNTATYIPVARCCACGVVKALRNIVCVAKRSPTPGQAWGCVLCQKPQDGAVAVVCDDCLNAGTPLQFVCTGYALSEGRTPIAEVPEPFEHNAVVHDAWLVRGNESGALH